MGEILQNKITTRGHYPVAADMYTDARTDFSRARNNKNATVLENMDSLESKTIDALIKYGVKPDERGVYYNSDSNVSKKFGKSRELKKAFDKNLEDIKKGEFNSDKLNFDAKLIDAIINKDRFDRNSSIQHAKLNKAYYDEQGRKHAEVLDRLDYNKKNITLAKNLRKNPTPQENHLWYDFLSKYEYGKDWRGACDSTLGTHDRNKWGWFLGPIYAPNSDEVLKDSHGTSAIITDKITSLETATHCDGARLTKYEVEKGGRTMYCENDFVLFRYADVLYMQYEAALRAGNSGKVEDLLNNPEFQRIRTRVNMPAYTSLDFL